MKQLTYFFLYPMIASNGDRVEMVGSMAFVIDPRDADRSSTLDLSFYRVRLF